MTLILVAGAGLLVLFGLLVFLPKKRAELSQQPSQPQFAPQPVPQPYMQYYPPYFPQPLHQQYAPPPQPAPSPAPAPQQMSIRQQEIQEKVRVLTTHFLDVDEDAFRKKTIDEALALMSQGRA